MNNDGSDEIALLSPSDDDEDASVDAELGGGSWESGENLRVGFCKK